MMTASEKQSFSRERVRLFGLLQDRIKQVLIIAVCISVYL